MVARMRDWCAKQSKGPRKRKNGLLPPSLVELRRTRSLHPPSPEGGLRRTGVLLAMTGWDHSTLLAPLRSQTRIHVLATRIARALHKTLSLEKKREQGMPGARCTRGLVCKLHKEMRTRAYRFSGGNPAFPAQWLYGLCRAPRRANSSCHRRCRLDGESDPVGSMPPPTAWHQQRVSGPHGFAVR
jgi:hypothetical protein